MIDVNVDEFDNQIKELKDQIKEINQTQLEPLYNKVTSLKQQKNKYILNNKIYKTFPLDERYIGKDISCITFIDSKGETEEFYNDETFNVDGRGFPHYSSFEHGVLSYSFADEKFVFWRYGLKYEKDFIGYTYLRFEDEGEF